MADFPYNPGQPIDHHAVTGSTPHHNPNPLAKHVGGGVSTQPTPPRPVDEHGGVMHGQLVRDPIPSDGKSGEQRQVEHANYNSAVQAEFDNPGSSEAPVLAQNNAMYDLAKGGNSVAASRVQDTDSVLAHARGDAPGTEYATNPVEGGPPVAVQKGKAIDNN